MSKGWDGFENDAIVADYFAMLRKDILHLPYSKTEHRRALYSKIERSEGSIEYKHQNISAVLKALGEDWILGYKPAFNFQMALVDAVVKWLDQNPTWQEPIERTQRQRFEEERQLWVGPAPTLRNDPDPKELEQTQAIAKKFNVAERDERNRDLGHAGEQLVFNYEKATLAAAGRRDLARKVSWVSQELGDGAGYDIASYERDGTERLVEVKTTNGWSHTPFYISRNEIRVAEDNQDRWVILRIHSFAREPRAFEIRPPLERHVALTAMSFRADFH